MERAKKLTELKEKVEKDIVPDTNKTQTQNMTEKRLLASYVVAWNIGKALKSFQEGEFIKSCMVDVVNILCPQELTNFKNLHLSRQTISRRIELLSTCTSRQVDEKIRKFVYFSLALDESTDLIDTAQLAIFVRGVDDKLNVGEYVLELIPLADTTRGEDIFNAVCMCVNKHNLDWSNLASIATDGARSMIGDKKGFIGRLKAFLKEKGVENIVTFHCILHQEALSAKSVDIPTIMKVVTQTINIIKNSALKHRQFRRLIQSSDQKFEDLQYFCDVRWLSRGQMLRRFFDLRNVIDEYMKEQGRAIAELSNDEWICDLAFLCDICEHLNTLNIYLQGRKQTVVNMYCSINAFVKKLQLWNEHVQESQFHYFPCLNTISCVPPHKLNSYSEILKNLTVEFTEHRFADLRRLENHISVYTDPFFVDVIKARIDIQEELIELQEDISLKQRYKNCNLSELYKHKVLCVNKYGKVRKFVCFMEAIFGTTYVCEQLFSQMKIVKSKCRSRLSDRHLCDQLRLAVCDACDITPDFNSIIMHTIHEDEEP